MESQRKPDLEMQGIDFGQESASKLLQQNVAIAKIKASNQELGKGEDEEVDMVCSQCGTKNKGARFCINCGAKL